MADAAAAAPAPTRGGFGGRGRGGDRGRGGRGRGREDQSEMKRRNGFQSLNSVVLSELGKLNPWRYSRSHSLECRLMMVGNLLTFFANQGIPNCRLFPS